MCIHIVYVEWPERPYPYTQHLYIYLSVEITLFKLKRQQPESLNHPIKIQRKR